MKFVNNKFAGLEPAYFVLSVWQISIYGPW